LTEADSRPVIDTDDSLDAIFDDYMEMEDMSEGADTYYDIQNALGDNPSEQAQQIANIAIESIRARLNIPATSVSLESDDEDKDEKNEDGFFTRVWKAIKNFFARIWGWIKGLFSKKKDDIKKNEEVTKRDAEALKTLMQQAGKHYDPDIISRINSALQIKNADENSKLRHFDILNKQINISDLLKIIEDVYSGHNLIKELSRDFETFISKLEDNIPTPEGEMLAQFAALQRYFSSVDGHSSFARTLDGFKSQTDLHKKVEKHIGESFIFISETIKTLNMFSRNEIIAYVKRKVPGIDECYLYTGLNFKVTDDKAKVSYSDTVSHAMTLHEAEGVYNLLETAIHDLGTFNLGLAQQITASQIKYAAVEKRLETLSNMEAFKAAGDSVKHIVTKVMTAVVNFSAGHSDIFTKYITYCNRTLADVRDLLKEIIDVHKIAVKQSQETSR
jgi:hypothetical protein